MAAVKNAADFELCFGDFEVVILDGDALAPECRIPAVLHGVVSSSWQKPGNVCPAGSDSLDCVDDDLVLFGRP